MIDKITYLSTLEIIIMYIIFVPLSLLMLLCLFMIHYHLVTSLIIRFKS